MGKVDSVKVLKLYLTFYWKDNIYLRECTINKQSVMIQVSFLIPFHHFSPFIDSKQIDDPGCDDGITCLPTEYFRSVTLYISIIDYPWVREHKMRSKRGIIVCYSVCSKMSFSEGALFKVYHIYMYLWFLKPFLSSFVFQANPKSTIVSLLFVVSSFFIHR